jgi:hypothetical protein
MVGTSRRLVRWRGKYSIDVLALVKADAWEYNSARARVARPRHAAGTANRKAKTLPEGKTAKEHALSKYYDEAMIPDELRRNFDVYDRIRSLQIPLGNFDTEVVSIANANIAGVVMHDSGLVYLSGTVGGSYPMNDDAERLQHGQQGGRHAADTLIKRLHWALSCGGEGDLNDILYTVKALGMVVSPGGGAFSGAPAVVNGFSFRWHSVFGGPRGDYANNGVDPGGFSGIHARSALGGFDGRFSIEAEIIVAIPPALARDIIRQRGWLFPLPPVMLDKVRAKQQ